MYDIIDFHAHVYPEKIAMRAAQSTGDFYMIPMKHEGSVKNLLESGDEGGVKRFVVQSVATTPAQVTSINNFIAQECREHPDRLIGLGTLHPKMENASEEIERCIALGLHGIKIHPDIQQFLMDDPAMFPIYDQLQGRLPMLIHCGDYRYPYSHPERLAHVLDEFPKLDVVAAHFGGWSLWDLAKEYLQGRRCWLDTSSSFAFLGKVRSRELIEAYGPERIVFGLDFPMWNHKDELEFFRQLGFSDADNRLMLHDNARNILKL